MFFWAGGELELGHIQFYTMTKRITHYALSAPTYGVGLSCLSSSLPTVPVDLAVLFSLLGRGVRMASDELIGWDKVMDFRSVGHHAITAILIRTP